MVVVLWEPIQGSVFTSEEEVSEILGFEHVEFVEELISAS